MPTAYGTFTAHCFLGANGIEHMALVKGDLPDGPALVRVHSECATGDIFGSLRCDCGPQLHKALRQIEAEGSGVLLYMRGHEGRGIGLGAKMQAYVLQENGVDTLDANLDLGLPADGRDYDEAAQILQQLGIQRVRLITNNPDKVESLKSLGLDVTERIESYIEPNEHNQAYLLTKAERMGHMLPTKPVKPGRQPGRPALARRRFSQAFSAVPTPSPQQLAVASVLSATTFNLLGFTMSLPINLALRSHFELVMGASFGSLTSAYPLGVLGALFLWPRLSDKIGRKPIIALSFAGSGLGLALQSWAVHRQWSLHAFLACRVLTGLCAGASPTAKAYLADLGASDGQLPRYMAWRDAAHTLAFITGPFLGGCLYRATGSVSAVIGATAAGSLLASLLVGCFVREPGKMRDAGSSAAPKMESKKKGSGSDGAPRPQGRQLVAAIATVCAMSALYNCGTSTFAAFFGPLAHLQSGLDIAGVGTAITALYCLSFAVSTTCAARAQKVFGTSGTAALGLLLISLGLVGMGAASSFAGGSVAAFWLAAVTYQIGVPLFGPTVPTLLLQSAPPERRGAMMALDEACNVLARIAAPIAFGAAFRRSGAFACLGCAGVASFAAALVAAARQAIISSQPSGVPVPSSPTTGTNRVVEVVVHHAAGQVGQAWNNLTSFKAR